MPQLLHLIIHNNPAAAVIELVSDNETLSHATVPRLPKGTILQSRVKYAIPPGTQAKLDALSMSGKSFSLGDTDEPLPTDITMADVLVIPQSVRTRNDMEEVMARLTGLCKPGANVVLTHESVTSSVLESKGFRRVFGVDGAVLYRQRSEHVNGVNGTSLSKLGFVIIEPSCPSVMVKSFSNSLQNALGADGYKSVAATWAELTIRCADEAKGKTYISLVEMETPLLNNLSEPDFEKVKKLISNCERLLWVNGSHNPSMAVVDGLSRTARNEYAGLKFQVLHLSSLETALQNGPSLVSQLSISRTTDDEFRERGGLLQTSRFFKSVTGNDAMAYCLEDSIQVQPLKDEERPEALRLTIGKPGLLDSLSFIHDDRFDAALGETEIEVDVKATGIKFD